MDRRGFIAAMAGGVAARPFAALAQQPSKIARVGFLGPTSLSPAASRLNGLRAGLAELGWVEGKNLVIEFRWAGGHYDRLADLAVELVRSRVDVLVTQGTAAAQAAKRATPTIPIVMAIAVDAVATGIIESLARPGGNVTGLTFFGPELYAKRLELLKHAMPRLARLAVVFNPTNPSFRTWFAEVDAAAKAMKVELTRLEIRKVEEFEIAFEDMARRRVPAFAITDDAFFNANLARIADLAARKRLLSAGSREFAEAGGVIGYGHDSVALFHRAAFFVDRILKGARPADLPVERPTKFELIVNLWSARAVGVTIPQALIGRADEVLR